MDGSQKLPQRLLATIAHRLEAGQGVDALSLAVAAWIRWQAGVDDQGLGHEVDDPLAHPIAEALSGAHDSGARVDAILGLGAIIPSTLAQHDAWRETLTQWLSVLETHGARAALARFAG